TAARVPFDEKQVPSVAGIPLIAKLGQGGMGAVYVGMHPRLKQEVAIKVLPFPLMAQQPDLVDRFYREAQIAARVKSNHLVGVLDVNMSRTDCSTSSWNSSMVRRPALISNRSRNPAARV